MLFVVAAAIAVAVAVAVAIAIATKPILNKPFSARATTTTTTSAAQEPKKVLHILQEDQVRIAFERHPEAK